jgi:hypothetical protein
MSADPSERRRAPRVLMPPEGGAVSVVGASIIDVSPYGMRIETGIALPVDSVMPFRLTIGGVKADVEARVIVSIPQAPGPSGRKLHAVGLDFVKIAPDVRERLREVLARA